MDYKLIDCDQHVIEPPDLWTKYLPHRFQDAAPKLVQDEDGGDAWLLGGHVESLGLVAAMNQTPKTLKWTGVRYADMHPGIIDPKGRLELMDEDGISAAVFFPPQRTMIYFMFAEDKAYSLAGMQAYNNFIRDWCSFDRSRLGAALIGRTSVPIRAASGSGRGGWKAVACNCTSKGPSRLTMEFVVVPRGGLLYKSGLRTLQTLPCARFHWTCDNRPIASGEYWRIRRTSSVPDRPGPLRRCSS